MPSDLLSGELIRITRVKLTFIGFLYIDLTPVEGNDIAITRSEKNTHHVIINYL